MIRRMRTTVFWPGALQEVRQIADCCDACQRHKPANQKETLHPHEVGTLPWEKIGADLCEIDGENYLVVVDYFSNFIEIDFLTTTTTLQIVRKLKGMFARWGIPCQIMTDCGSQFTSEEFRNFLKNWGISQVTSSPHYHQSNGKAESAVKIIKQMIKKCKENDEDAFRGLLELRNSPRQDTDRSPAELMLGRKPRSLLPSKPHSSNPTLEEAKRRKKMSQDSTKKTFDRRARDLKPIPVNSPVFYRTPKNAWGPGKVVESTGRDYVVLGENGVTYARNRVHVRPKHTPFRNEYEAMIMTTPRSADSTANTDGTDDNARNQPSPIQLTRKANRERKRPAWMKDYAV